MSAPGIPTGVHVIFEQAGRVLLMRRANTGFFDGLFSLPGGHVEPDESVVMAAIREMREELGVVVSAEDLRPVGVVHRHSDTNRIDFFLRADRWSGTPTRAEPDKCDRLDWFDRTELPDQIVPYVADALARHGQEPWVVESGWAVGLASI